MKKLWDLKNDLSYLELEGQGRGIIMEVTRPLLLRLFYFINRPPWANILSPSVVSCLMLSGCVCWFWMALGNVQWYWEVSTGVWSLVSPPQNEANFFSDKYSRKCTCHGIGDEAVFPPITRYMEVSTKLGILAHCFTKYPSCYRSHLIGLIHFYNQQNKLLLTFVWVLLISSCCCCIETKKKISRLDFGSNYSILLLFPLGIKMLLVICILYR